MDRFPNIDINTSRFGAEDVRPRFAHALSASAVTRKGHGYLSDVARGIYLAANRWNEDDASAMSASVAYYLALSLFPMLLLLTSGLGLIMRFTTLGQDAQVQLLSVVAQHCSPSLEAHVRSVLDQLQSHSLVSGPFGLVTAIMAAIGVFYQFERAFDRIWRIPPKRNLPWLKVCQRVLTERFSAFCLLAGLGISIVMILATNMALSTMRDWMAHMRLPGTMLLTLVEASATMFLNAMVFGTLFRFLPKRRVRWLDALRGGLLAAVVWEIGRQLLSTVLIGMKYTAAYGAIGSFIALLLWCYWGVSIIFFGAEYVQVLSEAHLRSIQPLEPSKLDQPPSASAAYQSTASVPDTSSTHDSVEARERRKPIVPRRIVV